MAVSTAPSLIFGCNPPSELADVGLLQACWHSGPRRPVPAFSMLLSAGGAAYHMVT
jgi:hypothetical protein